MRLIIAILLLLTTLSSAQLKIRKDGLQTGKAGVIEAKAFVAPMWGAARIGDDSNPFAVGHFDLLRVSRITGLSALAVDSLTQQLRIPSIKPGNFIVNSLHFAPFGFNQIGQAGFPAAEIHTERIYADNFVGDNAIGFPDLNNSGRYGLDTLTISTSDKIFVLGDSYLENTYCAIDKNPVSRWAEYSDFYVENFAVSGDKVTDLIEHLQGTDVVRSYPFTFLQSRPKYVVVETMINDNGLTTEQYIFGYRKLLMQIRAIGAEPILTTPPMHEPLEEDFPERFQLIHDLAHEYQVPFVDALGFSNLFFMYNSSGSTNGKPKALDGTDGHPNQMGARYWSTAMRRNLDWLKPEKAVNVYRLDNTGISGLAFAAYRDSSRFATDDSRRRRWDEISLSQKYGRIQSADASLERTSEYGLLANNSAVTFATGAALFEFTIPATEGGIKSVSFDVTAASGNYHLYALQLWSTSSDTATWRGTYGLSLPNLTKWDTLATFTSKTAITATFDADKYMQGNKLILGLFHSSKSSFTLSTSPRLIYTADRDIKRGKYRSRSYRGAEIVSEPYFDAVGKSNWTSTGVSYIDGDVQTWTFPNGGGSYAVRRPYMADDTSAVIGALTTRMSRTIDLSAYNLGDWFELEIWAQNAGTGYDDVDSLQVDIHFATYPATAGQTYTKKLEIDPVWMPYYIRFRKTLANTITVNLLPVSGSSDIYISKVGCRPVIYGRD